MKKSLIFAGTIFLTSGIAIAKTIDFDTSIKWNSNVVERALNKSGFLGASDANWDVRVTHERILAELLKKESFSVRDATRVCLDKCNMSDFLKNGRGASGKKCPELCSGFALQLINENNGQVNLNVMNPNLQDSSFSNSEGKPSEICQQLVSKAQEQGLTMPMLCGGKCHLFGDDKIIVTDNIKTIEFIVDDFCDGEGLLEEKEYYMIVSSNGAQDVTGYSEYGRLVELKKAQSKPASDYIKKEEQRKKEQRMNAAAVPYNNRVEKNGYCNSNVITFRGNVSPQTGHNVDCRKKARKYAQENACKLRSYTTLSYYGEHSTTATYKECYVNESNKSHSYGDTHVSFTEYNYTPTYQECVATFNEQKCNEIAETEYEY